VRAADAGLPDRRTGTAIQAIGQLRRAIGRGARAHGFCVNTQRNTRLSRVAGPALQGATVCGRRNSYHLVGNIRRAPLFQGTGPGIKGCRLTAGFRRAASDGRPGRTRRGRRAMPSAYAGNYGDTCNNPLISTLGFGPRLAGAKLNPVRASMSASHAFDPTGRPTLSALRNAA
jgi:hypothetical protein